MPVDRDGIYTPPVRVVSRRDKGIPVPDAWAGRNDKGYIAVVRLLEVGESVFLPTSYASGHSRAQAVSQERKGAAYVVRSETDTDGRKGCRIWRTA